MKRVEQKEERRENILKAALNLFIEKGYAATRTIDIAKSVGMSEGLLFHYFESKEKVYYALIEIGLSNMNMSFEFDDTKPIVFFENVASFIIDNCKNSSMAAKLFILMNYAEYDQSLDINLRSRIAGKHELEETAKIVERGQNDGSIRGGDPLALSLLFWTTINGVIINMVRNPEIVVPDVEWIVDILRNNRG